MKDSSYLETEQKIPTMIEGFQDYPDFKNQGNPSWQSSKSSKSRLRQ
jgi:hypothetical protein